jgi:hypothetical protein
MPGTDIRIARPLEFVTRPNLYCPGERPGRPADPALVSGERRTGCAPRNGGGDSCGSRGILLGGAGRSGGEEVGIGGSALGAGEIVLGPLAVPSWDVGGEEVAAGLEPVRVELAGPLDREGRWVSRKAGAPPWPRPAWLAEGWMPVRLSRTPATLLLKPLSAATTSTSTQTATTWGRLPHHRPPLRLLCGWKRGGSQRGFQESTS